MAAARTVWFSLHLGCHRSAVSLSALNVSPLTQSVPRCGDRTPATVPPPTEGRSNATNTPTFCPSSFIVPSFAWVYIFFSTGQVLLSPSAGVLYTFASEDVFLMYPWGEMYCMSTDSSAILFSSLEQVLYLHLKSSAWFCSVGFKVIFWCKDEFLCNLNSLRRTVSCLIFWMG